MSQFFELNINTIIDGIMILFIWNWAKKVGTPSSTTLKLVQKLEEATTSLTLKVAEINVWKNEHIKLESIIHKNIDETLRRMEATHGFTK